MRAVLLITGAGNHYYHKCRCGTRWAGARGARSVVIILIMNHSIVLVIILVHFFIVIFLVHILIITGHLNSF